MDLDGLARDLKERYKAQAFPANYVVVPSVISATSATVLISRSRKASVSLRAATDIALGGNPDLANIEAGLSVVKSQNLATQYVAQADLTPLFKVMGFAKNWYNGMPTEQFRGTGRRAAWGGRTRGGAVEGYAGTRQDEPWATPDRSTTSPERQSHPQIGIGLPGTSGSE